MVLLLCHTSIWAESTGPAEAVTDTAATKSTTFKDCATCPEMAIIPAGAGMAAFALGRTEVTQAQWRAVMGDNPSAFKQCGDDCPVEQVSWNDAQKFVQRLSKLTGQNYSLPTEQQWQYACLAGGQGPYCGSDQANQVAWFQGNSSGQTQPAQRKVANAWGLFDMSGNVWEWTDSCGNDDCSEHIVRGGSWFVAEEYLQAQHRYRNRSDIKSKDYGLRVARPAPQ